MNKPKMKKLIYKSDPFHWIDPIQVDVFAVTLVLNLSPRNYPRLPAEEEQLQLQELHHLQRQRQRRGTDSNLGTLNILTLTILMWPLVNFLFDFRRYDFAQKHYSNLGVKHKWRHSKRGEGVRHFATTGHKAEGEGEG